MRRPSTSTVQAPHWPWSQPFFVPVSFQCSRSASSSVVRVSSATWLVRPFTFSVTGIVGGAGRSSSGTAAASVGMAVAAAPIAPLASTPRRDMDSS